MHKVTLLKDIALKAGCSVNTVSLALKDSPRISEKTRNLVQGIAREFDYISNNMARALVLNKTNTVGLIIRNISSLLLTSEAQYIEQYLEQQGYTMNMASSHDDPVHEAKLINLMLANHVDGIIINTVLSDNIPRLKELRDSGYPVVLLSGFECQPAIDSVYPDLTQGVYVAVKHLLSIGHRKISFITGKDRALLDKDMKFKGYVKALTEVGIKPKEDLICSLKKYNSHIIDDINVPPLIYRAKNSDAFFFSEDELAIPVIKLLDRKGIRIPKDLSLASIDNIRFAESNLVALTTVGFDIQYLSHMAVDMLLKRINEVAEKNNEKPGKAENILIKPDFYIRESCGYINPRSTVFPPKRMPRRIQGVLTADANKKEKKT